MNTLSSNDFFFTTNFISQIMPFKTTYKYIHYLEIFNLEILQYISTVKYHVAFLDNDY